MTKKNNSTVTASLENPFAAKADREFKVPGQVASTPGLYEQALKDGWELQQKPYNTAGVKSIQRQHQKNRMTIWENPLSL